MPDWGWLILSHWVASFLGYWSCCLFIMAKDIDEGDSMGQADRVKTCKPSHWFVWESMILTGQFSDADIIEILVENPQFACWLKDRSVQRCGTSCGEKYGNRTLPT